MANDAGEKVGNMYFLTKGPSGPVRGAGFDYQQICQVEYGQIYCSSASVDTAYSPCPREWKLYNLDSQVVALLVPF